ncbi:hypothetical protein M0804_003701 [Polistes exclamans]|nr:hypothetical protein M0804_003701 [Polistes exclamans]
MFNGGLASSTHSPFPSSRLRDDDDEDEDDDNQDDDDDDDDDDDELARERSRYEEQQRDRAEDEIRMDGVLEMVRRCRQKHSMNIH